jgi:hypothetical protein
MTLDRPVITTIQTLVALFKDYFPDEDIPDDAKAIKLMIHPTTKRLGIQVVSDTWDGPQVPLDVKFEIKRVYSV